MIRPYLENIFRLSPNYEVCNQIYSKMGRVEITLIVIDYLDHFVKLSQRTCCYRFDTQDFGVNIDRLDAPASVYNPQDEFSKLSKYLGFVWKEHSLKCDTKGKIDFFIRDWLYPLDTHGPFLKPKINDTVLANGRLDWYGISDSSSPGRYSSHPFFEGTVGRRVECGLVSSTEKIIESEFFFEGGNFYVVTDPKNPGNKLCLMGNNGFLMAYLGLRESKFFKGNCHVNASVLNQKLKEFNDDEKQFLEALNQVFNLKLMSNKTKLSEEVKKDEDEAISYLTYLDKSYSMTVENMPRLQKIAAKFLIQQDIVKRMMGLAFNLFPPKLREKPFHQLPTENIVLIPSLAYHLDVFMRPGPKNSIFIQSFALTVHFLEEIESNAQKWNLTQKDHEILKRLLGNAKKMKDDLNNLILRIHRILDERGFTLIPSPGLFFDEEIHYNQDYDVNFLNAVTGWSEKTERFFYIVAGVKLGDQLGNALMDMWNAFLQQYVPQIDLFFIGCSNDFALSKRLSCYFGGFHCMTLEREKRSHLH